MRAQANQTEFNHYQWVQANQQYLTTRLSEITFALESNLPCNESIDFSASDKISSEMLRAPALTYLTEAFGLSAFEEFTLLICAGCELDAKFSRSLMRLDPTLTSRPNFQVTLSLFTESHWSAITPVAPLRHWRLIELDSGASVVTSPLHIDERILHFISGISYPDPRLKETVRLESKSSILSPSLKSCVKKIIDFWSPDEQKTKLPVVQLCGKRKSEMKSIAQMACQNFGLMVYFLDAGDIPKESSQREALVLLWQRESILDRAALIINSSIEHEDLINSFVSDLFFPCCVIGTQPLNLESRLSIRVDAPSPNSAEQIMLLKSVLGGRAKLINGEINQLVSQFNLTIQNIDYLGKQIENYGDSSTELVNALWQQCRIQSRKRLDSLAQRVDSEISWDDLILPPAQKQTLNDIIAQTRQRFKVYEEWGFSKRSTTGQGVSALFYGSSGTGKTMAASAIANELKLDLYRIDLSQVVNKYIGETEKNLARVFDAAEDSGAILLFDEADSLFAKRTEIKTSQDRNANLETSYLLQRMESYCGLAILTTNLKKEIDSAFMRRIRFALHFPFPDIPTREKIWQGVFPQETPLHNVDISKLASLDVAGGNIRNIAINAAFLATQNKKGITMLHLAKAARREFAKIEKSIKESELRSWV